MNRKIWNTILLLLLLSISSCTFSESDPPDNPSRQELIDRGFYMYVVPQTIQDRYGWEESTSLVSWDRHCKGMTWAEEWNPLRIRYNSTFMISLDRWNVVSWDEEKPSRVVPVVSPFIKGDQIEMYTLPTTKSEVIKLHFEDTFGSPIYITSYLNLTDTVEIVSELEYIGPTPTASMPMWPCKKQ